MQNQRGKPRRTLPSKTLWTDFEAAAGPAQFKLRTPQAILHVPGSAKEVLDSVGSVSVVLGSVDRF
eukprot:5431378-Alexandrium_andersonii.AAC.1